MASCKKNHCCPIVSGSGKNKYQLRTKKKTVCRTHVQCRPKKSCWNKLKRSKQQTEQTPNTKHQTPNTKQPPPNNKHQTPNTKQPYHHSFQFIHMAQHDSGGQVLLVVAVDAKTIRFHAVGDRKHVTANFAPQGVVTPQTPNPPNTCYHSQKQNKQLIVVGVSVNHNINI
jgi:hypothetical protein